MSDVCLLRVITHMKERERDRKREQCKNMGEQDARLSLTVPYILVETVPTKYTDDVKLFSTYSRYVL